VARCIDEGDLVTVLVDLIGADMLGDPPGFAGDHLGFADRIQKGGLAVIDVTHDRHHRRTRLQRCGIVFRGEKTFFDVSL